ncbi:hypothetical protein [Sphingomonas sp. HMP9]|uniref:hypothetical protein n=1 Tax=Sphingomonas sp. HMP9 TaxID=1517554 RepID=UPI001596707B|nr:hypothetical protein [Sphingomonas sp. HMP9]
MAFRIADQKRKFALTRIVRATAPICVPTKSTNRYVHHLRATEERYYGGLSAVIAAFDRPAEKIPLGDSDTRTLQEQL